MALTQQDLTQISQVVAKEVKAQLQPYPTRDEVRVIVREEVTKAVSEEIEVRELVTKDDLKEFVTKVDLANMENRQDEKYASKQDLQEATDAVIGAIDETMANHVKKHHSSVISIVG